MLLSHNTVCLLCVCLVCLFVRGPNQNILFLYVRLEKGLNSPSETSVFGRIFEAKCEAKSPSSVDTHLSTILTSKISQNSETSPFNMTIDPETCKHPSIGYKRKLFLEPFADPKFSSPMPHLSELSSPPPPPKYRSPRFRCEEEPEPLPIFLPEISDSDSSPSSVSSAKGYSLKPRLIFVNAPRSMSSIRISSLDDPSMDYLKSNKHTKQFRSPTKVQDFSMV